MDINMIVKNLEVAAERMARPAYTLDIEEFRRSERVFIDFSQTKRPYVLCKNLLELTQNPFVLFEVGGLIKKAFLREWTTLDKALIQDIHNFLFEAVLRHSEWPMYVKEKFLVCIAVLYKRGSADSSVSIEALFEKANKLIHSGNKLQEMMGCSLLSAVLNEFANRRTSVEMGLTVEEHRQCKVNFEEHYLPQVFSFCLHIVRQFDSKDKVRGPTGLALCSCVLTIIDQVLNWEFTPKHMHRRMLTHFTSCILVPFKPPATWRELLLGTDVVTVLFKVYEVLRFDFNGCPSPITQCLVQLATVNGVIFENQQSARDFLAMYLTAFLQLCTSHQMLAMDVYAWTSIINNLISYFSMDVLMTLKDDLADKFLRMMVDKTCQMGEQAAFEDARGLDDTDWREGYERLLQSWMLLSDHQSCVDHVRPHCTVIINSFIKIHLAPPDGCRSQLDALGTIADDDLDYQEEDDDDSVKLSEQLCCVGALGRLVPSYVLPLLANLLHTRVARLKAMLEDLAKVTDNGDGGVPRRQIDRLNVVNEDIHWLLLVSGSVLVGARVESETPTIPTEINQYSVSQGVDCGDIQQTVSVLSDPTLEVHIDGGDDSLRLILGVLCLARLEQMVHSDLPHLGQYLSPQVARSVCWVLARWAPSFLLFNPEYYDQVSQTFLTAFSQDSPTAHWLMDILITKLVTNLSQWVSEKQVLMVTIDVLLRLVQKRQKADLAVQSHALHNLCECLCSGSPPVHSLSAECRRLLCQALTYAGCYSSSSNASANTIRHMLLHSITSRFERVVALSADVTRLGEVQQDLVDLLDSACGVLDACSGLNSDPVYDSLKPVVCGCVHLMDTYHNYTDIILQIIEVFYTIADKVLMYLNADHTRHVYEMSLCVVQLYAKHNLGRIQMASNAKDDHNNSLVLMIQTLIAILTKDFVDFGSVPDNSTVSPADVSLLGLTTITPLIDCDILQLPTMSTLYLRLLTYLAESYPDKVCVLPPPILQPILEITQEVLKNGSQDQCKLVLEFLMFVGRHLFADSNLKGGPMHMALKHFLEVVFQMVVLASDLQVDLLDTAGETLFVLICCHQDVYQCLAHEVITSHTQHHGVLVQAFTELTPPSLQLSPTRTSNIAFIKNLDIFLMNVRGLVCVV